MPWQTLLIANPGRGKNPYSSKDVPRFTKSATTPRRKRQWLHVYESARRAGYSEGRAIAQASGVVKGRGRNPLTRRNQNLLTDAIAGDIANKVAGKVAGMFTSRKRSSPSKRKKTLKRKRRNPHLALIGANPRKRVRGRYSTREGKGLFPSSHSARSWFGGSSRSAITKSVRRKYRKKGKASGFTINPRKRKRRKNRTRSVGSYSGITGFFKTSGRKHAPKRKRHRKKFTSQLMTYGRQRRTRSMFNPRRKRSTSMARRRRKRNPLRGRPRDSKGRLLKVRNKRRSSSRRRRNTLAAPRRRRQNKTRVITRIKYRTRRVANVAKRRRRKAVRRHTRRRNVAVAVPKRRRRNPGARRGRRRSYRRSYRRRRNAGLGGLVGRVNFMQVAEVGIGVLAGDKITTYLGNTVAGWLGLTDATTVGLVKTGLGVVTAGLVWRFRPALGLGIAVGAVNGLINQYVFTPLWGMATPYLPGGMAGLKEYVNRDWRIDNWLAQGGGGAAVAGIGSNSLNRSSL